MKPQQPQQPQQQIDPLQRVLIKEQAAALQQVLQGVPPAAEPLQQQRLEQLYDAASVAAQALGQQPGMPKWTARDPQYDRVPPEVAVPAITLATFFGSEGAPPQARPYAPRDLATLLQTNDGLLELTITLQRAARDPALRAALDSPVPAQVARLRTEPGGSDGSG